MRSHTGEKPFICNVEGCDKSFSTSSSCKRHVLTHGHQNAKLGLLLVQSSKKRERVDDVDELPSKESTKRLCSRVEEVIPMQVTPLELKIVEEVMKDLEIPVIDPKKMTLGFILN
jgi:hypothetical protein